jgi:hypothetical protein
MAVLEKGDYLSSPLSGKQDTSLKHRTSGHPFARLLGVVYGYCNNMNILMYILFGKEISKY